MDNAVIYIDLKTRFSDVETNVNKVVSLTERASQSISSSFKKITFTSPPVKAYQQYIDAKKKLDSKSYKNFAEYEKLKTQIEKLEGHKRLQEYIAYKDKEKQHYENIGKSMTSLGTKLTIGVTAPLALISAQALKTAGSFEQYKVSFDTMLKSTEKSQKLLKDIEKFSASTPFQLPGLVVGAKRLLAFGVESDKVVDKLKNLGNAAGGNEEILDRLTLAYGKLQAKGKATMEELNMFIEAGVPLLDELAEGFNVTTAELSDMITKGKVGFEDVDKAITRLTTGTGQFAGMIEKQSQTLNGVVSTMKDNFNLLGKDIITVILPDLKKLAVFASDVASGFRNMDEGTKKAIVTIGGLALAVGPLLVVGGKLVPMFASIPGKVNGVVKSLNALKVAVAVNPILAVATAVSAAAIAFGLWYKSSHDINNINDDLRESTEKLQTSITGYQDAVKKLTVNTDKLTESEKNLLYVQKEKFAQNIQQNINEIIKAYGRLEAANKSGDIFFKIPDIKTREQAIAKLQEQIEDLKASISSAGNDSSIKTFNEFGAPVSLNLQQAREALILFEDKLGTLEKPLEETENIIKEIAKLLLSLKDNTEQYNMALNKMKPELRERVRLAMETLKTDESIAEKNKEIIKQKEEEKKAESEILAKRKELRAELDQQLKNQGKTELEQIEARRKAELKAASELYKNTNQIEEYNKVKADINKKYDFEISEYKKKVDRETLQTKIDLLNKEIEAVNSSGKKQIQTTGSLNKQAFELRKELLKQQYDYQKQILDQEHEEKIKNYQKDIELYKSDAEMKASIEDQMLSENESYNAELQSLAEETHNKINDLQNEGVEANKESLAVMTSEVTSSLGKIESDFSSFSSTLDEVQDNYVGMAETIGAVTQSMSAIIASAISEIAESGSMAGAALIGTAAGLEATSVVVGMAAEAMANETSRQLAIIDQEYEDTVASIQKTLAKQTAALESETEAQLNALKEYWAERGVTIETGIETEYELAQEAYEEALEALQEYNEEENEARLAQLEAYEETLQGKTDAEIEEAIEAKRIALEKVSDAKKAELQENANLKKAEMDKQKILADSEAAQEALEKAAAMKEWEAECKKIEAENKAQKENFETQKTIAIIQATIGMLMGIAMIWANSFANYPPIPAAIIAGIFTGVMAGLGAAQIAMISAQPPPADKALPDPPSFAIGATNYIGDNAFVGEEGTELVTFNKGSKNVITNENLEKLFMLAEKGALEGGQNITVQVNAQIYLDSEQIPISKIILNQRHFAGASQ